MLRYNLQRIGRRRDLRIRLPVLLLRWLHLRPVRQTLPRSPMRVGCDLQVWRVHHRRPEPVARGKRPRCGARVLHRAARRGRAVRARLALRERKLLPRGVRAEERGWRELWRELRVCVGGGVCARRLREEGGWRAVLGGWALRVGGRVRERELRQAARRPALRHIRRVQVSGRVLERHVREARRWRGVQRRRRLHQQHLLPRRVLRAANKRRRVPGQRAVCQPQLLRRRLRATPPPGPSSLPGRLCLRIHARVHPRHVWLAGGGRSVRDARSVHHRRVPRWAVRGRQE
mmetsp:Transcript_35537/g.83580  ORF Transcript_35537/g.83580 Transcript_35537/m.83580 type:complete len:288 (-) Transcript_35537:1250-2113(-)